jgi:hypothetical protein
MSSLFDSLSRGLSVLLSPVVSVVEEPGLLPRLMAELGVPPDANSNALLQSLSAIAELKDRIEALGAQQTPSFESIATVLDAAADAFEALRKLEQQGPLAALEGLGRELVDLLLMAFLESRVPAARPAAALLTLLEPADERVGNAPVVENGRLVRDTYRLDRWHFDRLPALLKDPLTVLRAEYGNAMQTAADANAMADKLFPRLERLLRSLGVSCRYGFDPEDATFLGDAIPLMGHALIVYVDDPLYGAAAESGVVLSLSAAEQGDLGLVISPFGAIAVQGSAGPWQLAAELTAGVDVVAWGRHGVTLLANPGTVEAKGSASATLATVDTLPAYVIGQPDGARIEVGGARIGLDVALSEAYASLAVSADVTKAVIVIAAGNGDGFLSEILPAGGLQAKGDLGLAWSSDKGLTLRGNAALEATVPVGLSFGGVTLSALTLALRPQAADVAAEVSASVLASIGPLTAVLDRIGVAGLLSFPPTGGNLGVANLDLGFKPPTGVGLAIDASVVVGGGFLHFDPQQEEYSGMLELQIAETIAVKAIGLLTTKMPDGGRGYSLVVIIFAEDFAPIQLGFGFALTGIGGLLAVNRTFNEEALRAGLKNHTLDSVMFPADPIRNAPQIISNLNSVFPPAPGHHLFGPMVQIAWGTPPLITAEVGVVLELGARLRLLILAQVAAILPKRENDLVRLQMDAIGVLDFDQGTAALDATLYDSRLLKKFVLTGDMAMRLKWEGSPNFALAVGGLHPAFNPPANFPKLERIALNLSAGDNPRLRCEVYFAITSNTVQFGARAELYAAASGFSILGEAGYDVLIQLDPFMFIADFFAGMQLKHGSRNLFKVRFEGALTGPRPLHVKGKATFEILWWDVSIRVNTTLIEGEKPPPLTPVDVLPRLLEALSLPSNWTSQLPDGQRPMVRLRSKQGEAAEVQLHPLGTLTVKQSVVPLKLEISRFGSAAPAGARSFTISAVSLGGKPQATPTVTEFFAPAQFFEMSDDEKLSRPSFEKMAAGVQIGSHDFTFPTNTDPTNNDELLEDEIGYETKLVTDESPPPEPPNKPPLHPLNFDLFRIQARFGAAGVSELRRTGTAKFRTTVGKHRVAKEGWSIVATDDLTPQPIPGADGHTEVSYSVAKQGLRQLQQENPAQAARFKILRLRSEIEAVK